MTRYFLADFRTGRQILDLNVMEGPYTVPLNAPETLSVKIDMQDPDMIALNLWSSAAKFKTLLGCAEGDTIMALGPIWSRDYSRDDKTFRLDSLGAWSYYDHRFLLPLVALTTPVNEFTIPDPSDSTKTIPNPVLGTNLSGLSLGTIAKQWVQQSRLLTGGDIPIVFQDDELGTHMRNTIGPEFQNMGEALRQLTKVKGGPDIEFRGRFTEDMLGVEFLFRTGTEAEPMLFANTVHEWDLTAPEPAASKLMVKDDASKMASLAWQTGGRSADTVLVARAYDPALVDAGYPLAETLDSSHSDVEVQSTLDAYAAEDAVQGRYGSEIFSFTAEAASQPIIGSYWPGDFADLTVGRYNPVTGEGDPLLGRDQPYRQRIIQIAGDHDGVSVDVQCAPRRAD